MVSFNNVYLHIRSAERGLNYKTNKSIMAFSIVIIVFNEARINMFTEANRS